MGGGSRSLGGWAAAMVSALLPSRRHCLSLASSDFVVVVVVVVVVGAESVTVDVDVNVVVGGSGGGGGAEGDDVDADASDGVVDIHAATGRCARPRPAHVAAVTGGLPALVAMVTTSRLIPCSGCCSLLAALCSARVSTTTSQPQLQGKGGPSSCTTSFK